MAAATKRQTFDNIADGTEITATSQTAGSGDQLSGLLGTGDKNVRASAGVRGNGLYIGGNGVSSSINYSGLNDTAMSTEICFKYNPSWTAPTAAHQLLQIRDASASKASCNWSTSKVLQILDAGGLTVNSLNGGAELPSGKYRLWIATAKGTGTGDGRLLYRLDNIVTGAVIDNFDSSAQNTGTTNYTEGRTGKNNASGISWFELDDFAIRSGDVALIDLIPQPAPMVIVNRLAVTRSRTYFNW